MRRAWFFCAWAALLAGGAAQAENVGRTAFALPSPAWELLVTYERAVSYIGGASKDPLYVAVYVLPGTGTGPLALLQITSTKGGHRNAKVQWVSDRCPDPRPKYFADDSDTNKTTRRQDCLIVNPAFSPKAFFGENPELAAALEARHMELFKSGYSIRSRVATETGEFLVVNLMTQKTFRGLPNVAPASAQLYDVPAPLVAWGEQLRDAVRAAAYSATGDLLLPPVDLQKP